MDEVKFNVRMLAAYKEMSITKLAKCAGINAEHLANVSIGRTKMTADDIVKLSEFTGIPPRNIQS